MTAGTSTQLSLATDNSSDEIFARIRNYLAGRAVGISQDRALLQEVAKCLFARSAIVAANSEIPAEKNKLAQAYSTAFARLREQTQGVFEADEELLLDPNSIAYVDGELSLLDADDPHADPLGSLYQAFVSSDLRMAEGQFFTPKEAVHWLVEAIDPQQGERVIDPACGSGGFLAFIARRWASQGVSGKEIGESLHGVEKDQYLASLARAHITLTTLCPSRIVCGDSIDGTTSGGEQISFPMRDSFDVVLANPPFGAKIRSGSDAARRNFDLAHKWARDKRAGHWSKSISLAANTPPQILFLELCVRLLKPGGRLGIVVPESLLTSGTNSYVVQWLREHAAISAVVGMPENLFKTSGKGGTHTKTCLVIAEKQESLSNSKKKIFMAEAKWCGHDSRGKSIPHNDLPEILARYRRKRLRAQDHLGYLLSPADLRHEVLSPRYYDPEPRRALQELRASHEIVSVGELVEQGILTLSTGDEVGKLAYGTGDIPFVRTSDISNWELKISSKHGVSDEVYEAYRHKQDVREGDVLMVRDGTYLIGECAYISEYDERIVYQSHLYKIRTRNTGKHNPFLLLALLSSANVKQQIRAKRFTQDIIDSLGKRILELELPVPKSEEACAAITSMVQTSIEERIEARELARRASEAVTDPKLASGWEPKTGTVSRQAVSGS